MLEDSEVIFGPCGFIPTNLLMGMVISIALVVTGEGGYIYIGVAIDGRVGIVVIWTCIEYILCHILIE